MASRSAYAAAAAMILIQAATTPAQDTQPGNQPDARLHWWSDDRTPPPFSFTYDGRPSNELLPAWKKTVEHKQLDDARTQHTLTWADDKTGLVVRCTAVEYLDYPVSEWTLYFRNGGTQDTPILADIAAIDLTLQGGQSGEFVLHRTVGDGGADIYKPDLITLKAGQEKRLAPEAGRPCSGEFPYFNIESPEGGMILAIGWPGQWAAKFTRDNAAGLHVTAGQELTHFNLLPGEELRSPLIVVQSWKGDRIHSQNLWRRWMIAHCLPHPGGKPLSPMMNVCNGNQYGLFGITEDNQRAWIDRYREEKIDYDYWWCDLGWFKLDLSTLVFNALYDPDPVKFPKGLKSLSDYLHTMNIRLIVWFEPEHNYPGPGNWITENHPEWYLKAPPGHEAEINQGMPLKDRVVVNLGNPDALKWLTDNIDRVIKEQGIDLYRHDFNIEPLMHWRNNDAPDRQGVTEIKYVTGFLAYYDELLRRHPGMLIDNCASGGRRNDVETLRRSVPLLRSDTWGEPVGQQCQTYGLANWIPFWGTGIVYSDPAQLAYIFRSQMGPSFTSCWDLTAKADYNLHRKLLEQWRSVRGLILNGDYYSLTPYSSKPDAWMAWQYNRPETGEGVVQAFRRDQNGEATMTMPLAGLDADADYQLTDLDTDATQTVTGRDLMKTGLKIEIKDRPGSALIKYHRLWKYDPAAMRPFWQSNTMHGESVLFVRQSGDKPITGSLIFPATKIISVKSSAGNVTYQEGKDYTWKPGSRELTIPPGSRIPVKDWQELRQPPGLPPLSMAHRDGKGAILLSEQGAYAAMQVAVTYEHQPVQWPGPRPTLAADTLPKSLGKLTAGEPLKIVLLGDSISTGANASGFLKLPPYQPGWQDLLVMHLKHVYKSEVTLVNLAVGGTDTGWGLTQVDAVTKNSPDLVILAFGMNDSGSRPTPEYQANTRAIIEGVRKTCPAAEFILIATMMGNKDWAVTQPQRWPEYRDALAQLCGPGIALADMTGVWGEMLKYKQYPDITGNGVNHPNDFCHRVYAQVLAALLTK